MFVKELLCEQHAAGTCHMVLFRRMQGQWLSPHSRTFLITSCPSASALEPTFPAVKANMPAALARGQQGPGRFEYASQVSPGPFRVGEAAVILLSSLLQSEEDNSPEGFSPPPSLFRPTRWTSSLRAVSFTT